MVSSREVKILDLIKLPLKGRSLIEASAGTGKTYSLSFVYLRLLLGLTTEAESERPLSVDEILVVTFTQAATQELRYRIRNNIDQLRLACLRGSHDDPSYQQLLSLITDRDKALDLLLIAKQQMDEAAIYTIHSFCQRMLTTYAFESGILFDQRLVQDEHPLYLQVVQDFWRNYFGSLSQPLAQIVLASWQDPTELLKTLYPYLNNSDFLARQKTDSLSELHNKINHFYQERITLIEQLKKSWREMSHEIESIITQSDIKKQSYNAKWLPKWLASITQWANEPNIHFDLPEHLSKFSQTVLYEKTKEGGQPPKNKLFELIDKIVSMRFSLKEVILLDIAKIVEQQVKQEKQKTGEIGFNDLLTQLNDSLKGDKGNELAKMIAKQYPAAMVDEFQDTDPVQYQIFHQIYKDRQSTLLLFIGDPKQAIYGFRGADIFTYIEAKNQVDNHFTMDVNWRSSAQMVDVVNHLFGHVIQHPFVFKEIPFFSMRSAPKNKHKSLRVRGNKIAALQCYLLPESVSTVDDYRNMIAEVCAEEISLWLSGHAYLVDYDKGEKRKVVSAADIAILVRTSNEAEIIQKSLTARQIKSVYLSERRSVFNTLESKELLRILQAILLPEDERCLRSALATQLIGFSMVQIETSLEDQSMWESLVDEFRQYQWLWFNFGILVMLRRLIKQRHLAENLLSISNGERTLTNLLHLGELLQTAAVEFETPHALLRWFVRQIANPDPNLENHEQRLESDENLVKIITIHKSKGLEYPLVWLPFIADHRKAEGHFYHDSDTYQLRYVEQYDDEIKSQIEKERLAEDLRLLYVAVTRSVYHCSIGLAGLSGRGKTDILTVSDAAIGYLLLDSEKGTYAKLVEAIQKISNATLIQVEDEKVAMTACHSAVSIEENLSARSFQRQLDSHWRLTSYSELQQISQIPLLTDDIVMSSEKNEKTESLQEIENEANYRNDDLQLAADTAELPVFDIHHFPKGAFVGTLLHELLEKVSLSKEDSTILCQQLISKLDLDEVWLPVLSNWLDIILSTALDDKGLVLSAIAPNHRLNEFVFYLPIKQKITAQMLDLLCKKYDPLSARCPSLTFADVEGMLKGFIDLIFEWNGKYYIVDYKSNWLGNSISDYNQTSMENAMCEHRYDLQYQLYTLALHRYLKQRIPDYDYQQHFGGVYYLFLRGMNQESEFGVFYQLPDVELILQLDLLFG